MHIRDTLLYCYCCWWHPQWHRQKWDLSVRMDPLRKHSELCKERKSAPRACQCFFILPTNLNYDSTSVGQPLRRRISPHRRPKPAPMVRHGTYTPHGTARGKYGPFCCCFFSVKKWHSKENKNIIQNYYSKWKISERCENDQLRKYLSLPVLQIGLVDN